MLRKKAAARNKYSPKEKRPSNFSQPRVDYRATVDPWRAFLDGENDPAAAMLADDASDHNGTPCANLCKLSLSRNDSVHKHRLAQITPVTVRLVCLRSFSANVARDLGARPTFDFNSVRQTTLSLSFSLDLLIL